MIVFGKHGKALGTAYVTASSQALSSSFDPRVRHEQNQLDIDIRHFWVASNSR
jgi:hypothetical protein